MTISMSSPHDTTPRIRWRAAGIIVAAVSLLTLSFVGTEGDSFSRKDQHWRHGWPLEFLIRRKWVVNEHHGVAEPTTALIFDRLQVWKFDRRALACDGVVSTSLVALTVLWVTQKKNVTRPSMGRQFGLRQAISGLTVLCVALGTIPLQEIYAYPQLRDCAYLGIAFSVFVSTSAVCDWLGIAMRSRRA